MSLSGRGAIVGIGFAQGGIFSFKAMIHFDALNPMAGVKKLFSMQAVVGLGRALAKVSLVGLLTWRGLLETATKLPQIDGSTDPRAMAAFMGQAILDGTFADFQSKILAMEVSAEHRPVGIKTLRGDTLAFGWEGALLVNGQEQPMDPAAAHDRAQHLLHTGYAPNPTVAYPSLGSWVGHELGDANADLPHFVSIHGPSANAGFLGVRSRGAPDALGECIEVQRQELVRPPTSLLEDRERPPEIGRLRPNEPRHEHPHDRVAGAQATR